MDNSTENIIHQGQVSSYDPVKHTARVAFDDWDGMVSGDLQILQPGSTRMRVKMPLQVGDHVLCLFQANGLQEGYVIGTPYTSSNMPDSGSEYEFSVNFPDVPITFRLNTETKKIELIAPESDVCIECKTAQLKCEDATVDSLKTDLTAATEVTITAPIINLNGLVNSSGGNGTDTTLNFQGEFNVQGNFNISGSVTAGGNINATGDIMAGGNSDNHHSH